MTIPVLAAGDNFVLSSLLADALRSEVGDDLEIAELTLPWPDEPVRAVAEVHEASGDEETLIEALQGVRVLVTQVAPLTRRILAACPELEFFGVTRGGPVNANIPAATEHGVVVSNAPGRNATATSEFAIGLILATLRRIAETHGSLSSGEWRGDYYRYDQVGPELEGTAIGVIGHGAVGGRVTRILSAFGASVLVYDPYVTVNAPGVEQVDELERLLAASEVVTVHARATAETAGMIDADALAAMPRGSFLVNCARGSIVDYEAACDALDSGHLAAAGFDVFEEEPLPADSRLLGRPNVVLTPHIAGASRQVPANAARIVARDLRRYLTGAPLKHCSNPEALAQARLH